MHLRMLARMIVIPAPDEQNFRSGLHKQSHGGHLHLGRGHIRNVMKTITILTQNILHLSV